MVETARIGASGRARLGKLCASHFWSTELADGVQALDVRLEGQAFSRHSHDTYTVVLTVEGVQEFYYRGGTHRSYPGNVVVLHPGEVHDGRPGTGSSFSYSGLQIDCKVAHEYVASGSNARHLPFIAEPVLRHRGLAELLGPLLSAPSQELYAHDLVTEVLDTLQHESRCAAPVSGRRFTGRIVRADQFLRANLSQSIRLADLGRVCDLSPFELCRQFKARYGSSPYRYLLMRRVQFARQLILEGRPLAEVAALAGFFDQSHMNRAFRSFVGLTPGAYATLLKAHQSSSPKQRQIKRRQRQDEETLPPTG